MPYLMEKGSARPARARPHPTAGSAASRASLGQRSNGRKLGYKPQDQEAIRELANGENAVAVNVQAPAPTLDRRRLGKDRTGQPGQAGASRRAANRALRNVVDGFSASRVGEGLADAVMSCGGDRVRDEIDHPPGFDRSREGGEFQERSREGCRGRLVKEEQ